MKIAITGAAGFIGSCMLWKLNRMGVTDILAVDCLGTDEKWKNLVDKQFRDYMESGEFLRFIRDDKGSREIDTVIHMGACSSTTETNASYLVENNFVYSKEIATWAIRNKKRLVYASSAATYGNGEKGYSDATEETIRLRPLNMYGFSKHLFDLWVIQNKLQRDFVGLKFFNVYGPNEYHKGDMRSMVHKGYEQVKSTGKIRLFKSANPAYGDGEQKRDFIYVQDVVEIIWFFLSNPAKNGIFNVGTGEAQTWNDLARALFSALQLPPHIEYIPMPAALGGKYQDFTQADIRRLREAGYDRKFHDLASGVKDYVKILEGKGYL